MKYVFICFSFFYLISCTVIKKSAQTHLTPVKLVFENYSISENNEEGRKSKETDSIDSTFAPKGIDSLRIRSLTEIAFSSFSSETQPVKIVLEVTKDSIWRYMVQNGIMIGDFSVIRNNSGIIHYYDKSKQFNYLNVDLFQNKNKSEITSIMKKYDRKIIKGYDCFKLILVETMSDSDFPGNTIYEMYVTDKIQLPAYALALNIPAQPGLFPLEVIIKESFLPGLVEFYRLVEID